MKKSDLIPGKHVVETQEGKRYLVMDGFLTREHDALSLGRFDDGLRHRCFSGLDIVRVFKVSVMRAVESILRPSLYDYATVVWVRDKKTEQQEQARNKLRELEHKQRQLAEEISKVREDLA